VSDVDATIDTYLQLLNETDAERRAALVERVWTPDARWVDPPLESEGYTGISDMVGGIHEHFPGHRFRRVSGIDTHHDRLRFAWELVAPDGTVVVAGIDVGELAADGRLQRVTGFFGELPASDAA
jgi:SnoaL-like protein